MKKLTIFICISFVLVMCTKEIPKPENMIVKNSNLDTIINNDRPIIKDTTKKVDSTCKDTVVHFDLITKKKLVGKWVETSNSFRHERTDTLEFTYDSKFFVLTFRYIDDTLGNYNDYFMNSVYKVVNSSSIEIIKRPFGFRKGTGKINSLSLRNDTILGSEIDNLMTADVRIYSYTKMK